MKQILRRVLAVLAGFVAGSVVNMGLIVAGGALVPPPAGTDTSTAQLGEKIGSKNGNPNR